MIGTCLCGAVTITVETQPEYVNDCNCTLCRKVGGAWGYFQSSQVNTSGKTQWTLRSDKPNPAAEIHFCPSCSSAAYFVMSKAFTDKHGPFDMVVVNMRLFDPSDLTGVEVRFPNGREWPGEGEFGYRRGPILIDDSFAW